MLEGQMIGKALQVLEEVPLASLLSVCWTQTCLTLRNACIQLKVSVYLQHVFFSNFILFLTLFYDYLQSFRQV